MPDEESIVVEDTGAFLPTTTMWDVSSLYDVDVNSEQFKELFVRLYQNMNNIATMVNLKDTGYYQNKPFVCGRSYFPDPTATELTGNPEPNYRQVYRCTFNFGALPNTATSNMLHGITFTSASSGTHLYGCATKPAPFEIIPLSDPRITLRADATRIYITTTADLSAYTKTYVVLEYIQS